MQIANHTAVITGGCSGLGLAVAKQLVSTVKPVPNSKLS